MKKKSNNKKPLVALVLLLLVGVVGGTFAYFSSSAGFENLFKTSPYNVTYEEEFISPENWTPGTTTEKTVSVTNNTAIEDEHEGINIAVRFKVEEEWSNGVSATLDNGEKAAVLNFADDFDTKFEEKDGYYYYLTELKPGETVNFLESVTFNKAATDDEDDATCVREDVMTDGVKTGEKVVCTGAGYADAEYTLNITAETVQADAYAEYWNTDVVINPAA